MKGEFILNGPDLNEQMLAACNLTPRPSAWPGLDKKEEHLRQAVRKWVCTQLRRHVIESSDQHLKVNLQRTHKAVDLWDKAEGLKQVFLKPASFKGSGGIVSLIWQSNCYQVNGAAKPIAAYFDFRTHEVTAVCHNSLFQELRKHQNIVYLHADQAARSIGHLAYDWYRAHSTEDLQSLTVQGLKNKHHAWVRRLTKEEEANKGKVVELTLPSSLHRHRLYWLANEQAVKHEGWRMDHCSGAFVGSVAEQTVFFFSWLTDTHSYQDKQSWVTFSLRVEATSSPSWLTSSLRQFFEPHVRFHQAVGYKNRPLTPTEAAYMPAVAAAASELILNQI